MQENMYNQWEKKQWKINDKDGKILWWTRNGVGIASKAMVEENW